jgi:hypothetical protein
MLIEFIGSTGAGKTTLANDVIGECREQGVDILLDADFVLKQIRLNWIKSKFARTLCVDLISSFACLATWRNNFEFYAFASRVIRRLPVAWLEKLNLARNVLKKIGIYEIVRRRGSDRQFVLVDEGTLHAAHNLFVHVSVRTNAGDLATFVRLVPLPDAAICIAQSESVLIEIAMERGHKRIPDRSYANTELFVKRASDTFDKLVRQLVLEKRMMTLDNKGNIIVAQGHQTDPALVMVLRVIGAEAEEEGVIGSDPAGIALNARH